LLKAADVVISGQIVSVQEQRFRLQTDSGQVYLLTLGRHARLDSGTLGELHRRRARVEVTYAGEPNMADGVASAIRQAAD
jgi:hypothetical protein